MTWRESLEAAQSAEWKAEAYAKEVTGAKQEAARKAWRLLRDAVAALFTAAPGSLQDIDPWDD